MNTKALKVFFIYSITLAVFVSFGVTAIYLFKSKSAYFFAVKLYEVCEYCVFATLLYHLLANKIAKKILIYSIPPFVIFALIADYKGVGSNFNNLPSLIEFLIFIIFLIYFFYEKMSIIVEYPLYQNISFWICMAFFIYFTGNFFFFLFINSSTEKDFLIQMQVIYSFVTICKNILMSVAFFGNERVEIRDENQMKFPQELELDSFTPNNNLN